MAVIMCPNCQGKLRFPDESPPRRVKCASCSHSFMAGPKGPIAASDSVTANKKTEPTKPAPKTTEIGEDFDFVDDEKPAPSRRRGEDDDDRPRSRSRRDDDNDDRPRRGDRYDDEDRPRAKPRRGDADDFDFDGDEERVRPLPLDDEDDERPRSRRRNRDYDDDDDRPRYRRRDRDEDEDDGRKKEKSEKAQYQYARQGLGLISIGFWCQVGALGVFLLALFIGVVARQNVDELFIIAALPGIACWILGCVGFSFLLAGPRKYNLLGLIIALVAVAGIHLLLLMLVAFQKEHSIVNRFGGSSVNWQTIPTQFYQLTVMIFVDHFIVLMVFTALLELARFILFALVIKEYGRLCKNKDLAGSATMQLIFLPSVLGVSLILFLVVRMVAKNERLGEELGYAFFAITILCFAGYIAVYCMSAVLCGKAKYALVYRKK